MKGADGQDLAIWEPKLAMSEDADGVIRVWREDPLGAYPRCVTLPLFDWAARDPDRIWIAERDGPDGWRRVSYGQAAALIPRIGQALLDRGLSVERPLLILSGNSVDHALLALGAQHVGIPSAAVAPAYALLSDDHAKLRHVAAQLTPGMVFAADGAAFQTAIEAVFAPDLPVLSARNLLPGRGVATSVLLAEEAGAVAAQAHAAVGSETVAKFLFTSGTTGSPKAVIQTHGNICANQAMVIDCYAFLRTRPPIICDWAPWNHVAAGTKSFYMVFFNGGTQHIDNGKPTTAGIEATIRNIKDVAPSWYFNVPAGYELLVKAMEADADLRDRFFARLDYLMYAGAGMAQHCWDALGRLSEASVGRRVLRSSGYGATETGPFALSGMRDEARPGNCGIPGQGVEMKLVPEAGKLELRLRGPAITPGYWRDAALTAAAFDDEGYYRIGDAMRFAVPGNPAAGFLFDGRLAENFKLGTGTWVAVGPLRGKLVDALGGLARDAVIAGENRTDLAAMILPFLPAMRALVADEAALDDTEIIAHPAVRDALAQRLATHAAAATGSASRVMRLLVLAEAPSFDKGEITDKGSLNQRAILRNRADLVEALYAGDPRVVTPTGSAAA
ncbi:MAG: feruloyl-CoA synthase [Pseudomonadota bacterium]